MLNKFFYSIGVLVLVCMSFLYTEKVAYYVRQNDPIMKSIMEVNGIYKSDSIDVMLIDNYVIPGISGSKINYDDSYYNMKKVGMFNSSLLVFESVKPNNSIDKIYDKYIIKGNKSKNMVSLVIKIPNKDDLNVENIINILNENEVKAVFYVDLKWVEENTKEVDKIVSNGFYIGYYGYDNKYDTDLFVWGNTVLKKYSNNTNYCLNETEDNQILNTCKNNSYKTIKPTVITNPLKDVKKYLESGSIFSFELNDKLQNELFGTIKYIKQKGYTISILDEHLKE